jgi:hypothetical protein
VWLALGTLAVTALVAITGYVAKYINDLRIAQHAARLDRLNRQLSEFYGPLFALAYAGGEAWTAALSTIFPTGPSSRPSFREQEPTPSEAAMFRLWMVSVFMPLNRRLVELILTKADLLVESEMPEVLLRVCTNVLAYEANLKSWDEGDFSRLGTVNDFPGEELRKYASVNFDYLKKEQAKLLQELRLA